MQPGEIVTNLLIRLQEEEKHKKSVPTATCEKYISKHSLTSPTNTIVPKGMIEMYTASWKALLEIISDFLILGEGVWLPNGDIEFFDFSHPIGTWPTKPLMHSFRSYSVAQERDYLTKNWLSCREQITALPNVSIDNQENLIVSDDNQHVHNDQDTPEQSEADIVVSITETTETVSEQMEEMVSDVEGGTEEPSRPTPLHSHTQTSTGEEYSDKAWTNTLGKTPEVLEIDNLRATAKTTPVMSNIRQSEEAEALFSRKALQKYNSCSNTIRVWERDFMSEKGTLPTTSDVKANAEILKQHQQKKIASKVLKSWKITVHL